MAIDKFDIKLVDITSALIYFGMQFKDFFLVAVPQMLLGFSLILLVYSLYVFFCTWPLLYLAWDAYKLLLPPKEI
jgi:hypothetical protein